MHEHECVFVSVIKSVCVSVWACVSVCVCVSVGVCVIVCVCVSVWAFGVVCNYLCVAVHVRESNARVNILFSNTVL